MLYQLQADKLILYERRRTKAGCNISSPETKIAVPKTG